MEMHKEELARAKKSFAKWRGQRKRGEKIPPRLWDEACRCARLSGKSHVATILGLNSSHLKFEMELRQVMQGDPQTSAKSLVPIGEEVEARRRVTVTKIVSLESSSTAANSESWNVISPDGWKFFGQGAGGEQALRIFVEAVTRCEVKS